MNWPTISDPPVITTQGIWGPESKLALNPGNLTAYSSQTWGAANRAIFVPCVVLRQFKATQMFVLNGATVSGNIDVGIYAADGTRLVSKGSTAQSGTSTNQNFDITDTVLSPGRYYLAVALDNTTATLFVFVSNARTNRSDGYLQQSSAFPLPAIATFESITDLNVPLVGMTKRSFV